jgi:hypothetical protein
MSMVCFKTSLFRQINISHTKYMCVWGGGGLPGNLYTPVLLAEQNSELGNNIGLLEKCNK